MQVLPWIICAVLGAAALFLAAKLFYIQRDLNSLTRQIGEKLRDDTNTALVLSGGGHSLRKFAGEMDRELKKLRAMEQQYLSGDRRVKNAVTSISHDLRTPLTAISGYLELLSEQELPEAAHRYLAVIESRTAQMRQLTEELFRYSIILSEEDDSLTETVCINEVLEESVAAYYAALQQKQIVPDISITEQTLKCRCSRSGLTRVFMNLLNNALKYSTGDLRIAMDSSGVLRFSNHAAPIGKTQLEQLFERYYTVESAQHSTGLGLSIARTFTEQIGGSIAADYADGMLTITVRLPLLPQNTSEP